MVTDTAHSAASATPGVSHAMDAGNAPLRLPRMLLTRHLSTPRTHLVLSQALPPVSAHAGKLLISPPHYQRLVLYSAKNAINHASNADGLDRIPKFDRLLNIVV